MSTCLQCLAAFGGPDALELDRLRAEVAALKANAPLVVANRALTDEEIRTLKADNPLIYVSGNAVAEEREACALAVEAVQFQNQTLRDLATAIRARGSK